MTKTLGQAIPRRQGGRWLAFAAAGTWALIGIAVTGASDGTTAVIAVAVVSAVVLVAATATLRLSGQHPRATR